MGWEELGAPMELVERNKYAPDQGFKWLYSVKKQDFTGTNDNLFWGASGLKSDQANEIFNQGISTTHQCTVDEATFRCQTCGRTLKWIVYGKTKIVEPLSIFYANYDGLMSKERNKNTTQHISVAAIGIPTTTIHTAKNFTEITDLALQRDYALYMILRRQPELGFSDYVSVHKSLPLLKDLAAWSGDAFPTELGFYADFESANLRTVSIDTKSRTCKLLLKSDSNTSGFAQWFSFGVKYSGKEAESEWVFEILNMRMKRPNSKTTLKMSTIHVGQLLEGATSQTGLIWETISGPSAAIQYGKSIDETAISSSSPTTSANQTIQQQIGTAKAYQTMKFKFKFNPAMQRVLFSYATMHTFTDLIEWIERIESKLRNDQTYIEDISKAAAIPNPSIPISSSSSGLATNNPLFNSQQQQQQPQLQPQQQQQAQQTTTSEFSKKTRTTTISNSETFYRKELIGGSRLGLSIQVMEITAHKKAKNAVPYEKRKIILLLARQHPFETVSSFVVEGFVEFLLSKSEVASMLKRIFIFKIVPMVNPDGVVLGNSRTNLSGADLNRIWDRPNQVLHPEVFYLKEYLKSLSSKRELFISIDLHGTIRQHNTFFVACEQSPMHLVSKLSWVTNRLLAKLMQESMAHFDYSKCAFNSREKSKCTARSVLWTEVSARISLTFELSMHGYTPNACFANSSKFTSPASSIHSFQRSDYHKIGREIAENLLSFAYMTATIDNELITSNTNDLDIQAIYSNPNYYINNNNNNNNSNNDSKDLSSSLIEAAMPINSIRDATHSISSLKKITKPPAKILLSQGSQSSITTISQQQLNSRKISSIDFKSVAATTPSLMRNRAASSIAIVQQQSQLQQQQQSSSSQNFTAATTTTTPANTNNNNSSAQMKSTFFKKTENKHVFKTMPSSSPYAIGAVDLNRFSESSTSITAAPTASGDTGVVNSRKSSMEKLGESETISVPPQPQHPKFKLNFSKLQNNSSSLLQQQQRMSIEDSVSNRSENNNNNNENDLPAAPSVSSISQGSASSDRSHLEHALINNNNNNNNSNMNNSQNPRQHLSQTQPQQLFRRKTSSREMLPKLSSTQMKKKTSLLNLAATPEKSDRSIRQSRLQSSVNIINQRKSQQTFFPQTAATRDSFVNNNYSSRSRSGSPLAGVPSGAARKTLKPQKKQRKTAFITHVLKQLEALKEILLHVRSFNWVDYFTLDEIELAFTTDTASLFPQGMDTIQEYDTDSDPECDLIETNDRWKRDYSRRTSRYIDDSYQLIFQGDSQSSIRQKLIQRQGSQISEKNDFLLLPKNSDQLDFGEPDDAESKNSRGSILAAGSRKSIVCSSFLKNPSRKLSREPSLESSFPAVAAAAASSVTGSPIAQSASASSSQEDEQKQDETPFGRRTVYPQPQQQNNSTKRVAIVNTSYIGMSPKISAYNLGRLTLPRLTDVIRLKNPFLKTHAEIYNDYHFTNLQNTRSRNITTITAFTASSSLETSQMPFRCDRVEDFTFNSPKQQVIQTQVASVPGFSKPNTTNKSPNNNNNNLSSRYFQTSNLSTTVKSPRFEQTAATFFSDQKKSLASQSSGSATATHQSNHPIFPTFGFTSNSSFSAHTKVHQQLQSEQQSSPKFKITTETVQKQASESNGILRDRHAKNELRQSSGSTNITESPSVRTKVFVVYKDPYKNSPFLTPQRTKQQQLQQSNSLQKFQQKPSSSTSEQKKFMTKHLSIL